MHLRPFDDYYGRLHQYVYCRHYGHKIPGRKWLSSEACNANPCTHREHRPAEWTAKEKVEWAELEGFYLRLRQSECANWDLSKYKTLRRAVQAERDLVEEHARTKWSIASLAEIQDFHDRVTDINAKISPVTSRWFSVCATVLQFLRISRCSAVGYWCAHCLYGKEVRRKERTQKEAERAAANVKNMEMADME